MYNELLEELYDIACLNAYNMLEYVKSRPLAVQDICNRAALALSQLTAITVERDTANADIIRLGSAARDCHTCLFRDDDLNCKSQRALSCSCWQWCGGGVGGGNE